MTPAAKLNPIKAKVDLRIFFRSWPKKRSIPPVVAPVTLIAARCATVVLGFSNIEKVFASELQIFRSLRRLNFDQCEFDFLTFNFSPHDRGSLRIVIIPQTIIARVGRVNRDESNQ
jgi:hypothetical protein